MEIKAADVMKLRKMTGAGMMDCKNALMEAEGDFARAQDIIREKGKLVVAKRAERNASEGVVVTRIVGTKAYMLCLACETDFVAQNAEFAASANAMIDIAVAADAADKDTLMAVKNAEGRTVEEMVTHAVAMQATAMAPIAIDVADCPADVVAHERQIAIEAMKQDPKNAGKPEAILEKIAEGKMRKFFEENTLLNQELVGEKKTIAQYIHEADKEATVVAYKRFALES